MKVTLGIICTITLGLDLILRRGEVNIVALNITNKDLHNVETLAPKLYTLAEIVVRKHFYASLSEKEDLVSVGVLKAIKMIDSGNFDSNKGNLCTFLYTGMRNEMHNYLYHVNKYSTSDLSSILSLGKDDSYFDDYVGYFSYSLVHGVCLFFNRYFPGIEEGVIYRMHFCGLGLLDNVSSVSESVDVYERYAEACDRVIGVLLWKKKIHDRG